jgi:hypothetical protein
MAAGTWKWLGKGFISAYNKEIDFQSGAAIRMLFSNATEVPDQDVDDYVDDMRANEVTGTNLAADGVLLATCVVTWTGGTNTVKFDCDDVSVSNVTATGIKNSHICDFSAGTDATRPQIGFIVWDAVLSPSAATLSVVFDAAGIATITLD